MNTTCPDCHGVHAPGEPCFFARPVASQWTPPPETENAVIAGIIREEAASCASSCGSFNPMKLPDGYEIFTPTLGESALTTTKYRWRNKPRFEDWRNIQFPRVLDEDDLQNFIFARPIATPPATGEALPKLCRCIPGLLGSRTNCPVHSPIMASNIPTCLQCREPFDKASSAQSLCPKCYEEIRQRTTRGVCGQAQEPAQAGAVATRKTVQIFQDEIEAHAPEIGFWQSIDSRNSPLEFQASPHRGEGGASTMIYQDGALIGLTVLQRDEANRTVLVCVDLRKPTPPELPHGSPDAGSLTPRTDWEVSSYGGRTTWLPADFARQLECELAMATDAANKGDEARRLAGAMEAALSAQEAQSAKMRALWELETSERRAAQTDLAASEAVRVAAETERDELQQTFDLMWKADRRGVEMWRAEKPGRDLKLPDRGNLIAWILERMDESRENEARLRRALDGLLKRYTELIESGDAGHWDAEKEAEVIAARDLLKTLFPESK